ncbi:XK-related protein 8 [Ictalurus punctatus]|uniref:XK-related protein n=1 Tax=Ictalurus punctatus TaxID=7998 RepID=A0A2D0S3K7_ICTPU|nr:XK-related protein 8 [Ictalurus punctatus]
MKNDFSFWSGVSDVLASLLSLLLFFWNVAANVWTVISFYQDQKYISMGVFLFLILSSSVLLQIFSWLWYSDSSKKLDTKVERFMNRHGLLALVHILQLGVFLRCLGMLELSISSFERKDTSQNWVTESLNSDLSTLGLFQAFSESAPQLVLIVTNIIQMQDFQFFTVVKIVGSLSSLSFTMLSYHRNMCAYAPKKEKMGWSSSVIYFLWNLFLIGPRVVCVSLFASVLPCHIAAHFLSLWTLLVLWAWWQKTDFMDTNAGEWLYRATVALIWYFSWFNVASRSPKLRGIIYHMVIGVDTMLLLGLWWWRRSVESARLDPLPINPYLLIAMLIIIYIIGVLLKLVYYQKFHSKQPDLQLDEKDEKSEMNPQAPCNDTVDGGEKPEDSDLVLTASALPQRITSGVHKRTRNMAVNFYCE